MLAPESLQSLAAEFVAMSPRAQRAVLRSLDLAERECFTQVLDADMRAPADNAGAAEGPFSPWLAERIAQARGGVARDGSGQMTGASSQLLVRIADALTGAPPAAASAPGRSLFDAVGGFLSTRRPRA